MDGDENRWRPPSLLWILLIICTGLLFFVDVFQLQYYKMSSALFQPVSDPPFILYDEVYYKGFLIKSPGCRIPDMDPFSPTVKKFIEKENRAICNKGIPSLVESNITSIYINISNVGAYGINETYQLKCCYQSFWRIVPKKNKREEVKFNKECIEFQDSANITDEFIKVVCSYNDTEIYKDLFSFVPLKSTTNVFSKPPLNVLIIGLDAVSRVNLHRQLPKTVNYLKELKSYEFLGYNKVGDNTFPNLIPVLTGLTEKELQKNCWNNSRTRFDNCPFIWKDFKNLSFLTSFGEDSSWMGIFNYQRYGFKYQPTDYMWGDFNLIAEREIGNQHRMNVQQCIGAREVYKTFLNYIKNFVKTMCREKRPYFSFYWGASLSHDFLNMPSLGDDDYKALFEEFYVSGCLKQTALIFMSDHGIRWGGIRSTYQGRLEERLPFVHIILPEWYRKEYHWVDVNLKKNIRRLTTPFDLHETLKDLLHPYQLTKETLDKRLSQQKRGYSLFEAIPLNRTCEDAAISSHWCTCQESILVNKSDPNIIEAANFTVNYINDKLNGYAVCAILTLDEVLDARLHTHGDHILNGNNNTVDYTISLRTTPGGGIFEATVRAFYHENTYDIAGTISRLNLYGKQSLCITDFHLKLYCYCNNLV